MSISEHEINYLPSRWNKRFDHMQIMPHFYKFGEEVTENARKTLQCELDIAYDTTERTKYDVYGTDLPKDAPIFVFIYGGYWLEGTKEVSAFAAPVFVNKGIKVITVGYDLCPNVKFGDIVSEIKKAVEQILKYALTFGSRGVWVSGHSAGAHLAASLLFDPLWMEGITKNGYLNLLKGIVLFCGIFNLKALIGTTICESLKLTQNEIDAYSLSTLDIKNNKPIENLKVIVSDGECNAPGLINESQECAQKLITMVDNVQYIFLRDNIDHFNIVEKLTDEEFVLTKMILNNVLYNNI